MSSYSRLFQCSSLGNLQVHEENGWYGSEHISVADLSMGEVHYIRTVVWKMRTRLSPQITKENKQCCHDTLTDIAYGN